MQTGNKAFWRLTLALTTGEGRNQSPDWRRLSYAFRWEWRPFGAFKNGGNYVESDVFREGTFKLVLATSYIFNHNAIRSSSQIGFRLFEPTDIHTAIVAMLAKYQGLSLEVEYYIATRNRRFKSMQRIGDGSFTTALAGIFNLATSLKISLRWLGVLPSLNLSRA